MLCPVNKKSLVRVRQNDYSVPVHLSGLKIEVRLGTSQVLFFHGGKEVACHQRLHGKGGFAAELEHYLPLLRYKPGALSGSLALAQAREHGRWPVLFDLYWEALKEKYGDSGTKIFIETSVLGSSEQFYS